MKGISPLIAVVLLIAFTIVVGGIFLLWSRGFVGEATVGIEQKAEEEIECAYGFIELRGLKYCDTQLSGMLLNRGTIKLKNITIHVLYPAPRVPFKFPLCLAGGKVITCEVANLSLEINEAYVFNISTDPGFTEVKAFSHCPGISHSVKSDLVEFC